MRFLAAPPSLNYSSNVLLTLVVAVCFGGVFFTLLHDGEKTTLSDVLISLGLGLSLLSAVDVAARFLHLPLNPTVLAASVLLGGTAIVGLYRRKIRWGSSSAERPLRRMRRRWLSLVLVLLFVAPVSLAGIEMGRGPWPELFFNVDTGYYLTHVHELLRDDAYPPASLFTSGEHFAYHRGTQNIVAVLARLSEWPAHRMFFLLVAPLLPLCFAAVSWRIADRAALRGVPHALAMLIMLFFVEYPAGRMVARFAGSLDGGVGQALQSALGSLASSQVFRGGFPMSSRNEGMFLIVATVYALFFARNRQSVWIAALSVGLLPLFKAAYFVPAGVLLGLWAVAMVVRTRSIGFALIPAIAFFLGLALALISTNPTASLVVSGRALAQNWDRSLMFAVQMVLSGAVAILVVRTGCGRPYATASLLVPWGASLVALCLSCFLMIVYVDYRQIPKDDWDAAQILYPTAIFMSVALILLLMRAWTELRATQRVRLTRIVRGPDRHTHPLPDRNLRIHPSEAREMA